MVAVPTVSSAPIKGGNRLGYQRHFQMINDQRTGE